MKLRKYEISNQVEYFTPEMLQKGLENKAIERWAYILHDKDDTADHYHVMIWLKDSYDSKYVALWFGQKEQYVVKIKDDAGALEYLTHENHPEKHHYDKSEVRSNFDLESGIAEAKERKSKSKRLNQIIEGIDSGEIRAYNFDRYISCAEYVNFKRQIDTAFAYRTQKVKGVNRSMKAVYITGPSGSGKTTYAKQMAEQNKFSVYISSGSNDVLDDYAGQDCIILDDLRPSCMGLSDLLKMLDNNTASSVKSRYRNKVLECKMIIITTTLPIDQFFAHVFTEQPESAVQLQRRCEVMIEMTKDKISFHCWNASQGRYVGLRPIDNFIVKQFAIKKMTQQDALKMLSDVLGSASDIVGQIKVEMEKDPGAWKQESLNDLPKGW